MLPRSKKLARPSLCTAGLPYGRPVVKTFGKARGANKKRSARTMEFVIARSEATKQSRASRHRKPPGLLRFARNDEKHLSPLRGGKSSQARVRGRFRESERSRSSASAIHNDQSSGSAYAPSPRPSPRAAGRGSGTGTRRIAGLSLRIVMRARRPCASRRSIAADRLPGGTGNTRITSRS